jgi:hypothetical protein
MGSMISRKLSRSAGIALATSIFTVFAIALGTLVPVAASADSCPNAAERFGASANLPDCRAYELVTPMIKEDNDYLAAIHGFSDGNHVDVMSFLPYPGAENGQVANTLSTRTGSGWVSTSLTPPQGPGEPDEFRSQDNLGQYSFQVSFTSDFSAAFVNSPYVADPLDQDRTMDDYRVDIPSHATSLAALPDNGSMTEALVNPPGVYNENSEGHLNMIGTFVAGNSADGSHVFFETSVALPTAPGTPAFTPTTGQGLYERYGGHTYLVGILPDGSLPACGAEVGNGGMNASYAIPLDDSAAIAPDGSNMVFRSPSIRLCPEGNTPKLYLREHNGTPQARTVEVSGVELLARSADGSKLLTADSAFFRHDEKIYVYDITTEQTSVIGEGAVVAFSPDLSHVYYMANPHAGSDGSATSGTQLYLYENGVSKPIMDASAAAEFASTFHTTSRKYNYASTTADGSELLFLDRASLTSYSTEDPTCLSVVNAPVGLKNAHCAEAYVYDATNGSVMCVSCNPNGTPPVAAASLFQSVNTRQAEGSFSDFISPEMVNIAADGSRVFFETEESLVPQDTNGVYDVYEWESGHLYLLSSGHGSYGSFLDGVGDNGNDVFIQSTDNLLPQDVENSQLVYDARVDGGFPYTPPVYGCDSGQCQGPQTPAPIFAPPPSATFVGLGNPISEEAKPALKPKTAKRKAAKKKQASKRKAKARGKAKGGNSKRRGRN